MKKYFLLIAFCFSLLQLQAQRDSSYSRIISIVPQYVFVNGLRFDYDSKVSEKAWLQFSFEGFANERTEVMAAWCDEYNYDMAGLGLGFHYRYYLLTNSQRVNTYIAPGITGNFFKTNNVLANSDPEESSSTTIWRSELNLIVGQQYSIADKLTFDLFAGLGYRRSFNHYSNESARRNFAFNDDMFSYGFTGNVMILGFRFGYKF